MRARAAAARAAAAGKARAAAAGSDRAMAVAVVAARAVEAVMVRAAGGKAAAAKMEGEEEMTRGTRRQGSLNKANRSRSLPPGTAS